jgi:putative membrane protein
MKRSLPTLGLAIATALIGWPAMAQTSAPSAPADRAASTQKPNKADQHFLSKAIQGDISEVNMGKLAQDKGQSDEVKQFGKMLEQDHGAHLQKAQQMAGQMGVNAPTEPDAKSKATYDKLSKTSEAQFDSKFAQAMASDHKREIAEYKQQSKSKGPLADFATETVPTLEEHLKTAESLTRVKRSRR